MRIRDENIVRRVLRKSLLFHCRAEDVSTISKFPVTLGRSVQSMSIRKIILKEVSHQVRQDSLGCISYIYPEPEILTLSYIPRQGPAVKNCTEQGSVCGHAFHRTFYG